MTSFLDETREIHDRIITQSRSQPTSFSSACIQAADALAAKGIKFERTKQIPTAISPLLLDEASLGYMQSVAEELHAIVEHALDWVTESKDRLRKYFPHHARMFPFLGKTRGSRFWQCVSRYDVVVTPTGKIRFIELNTGCPAGFMHAEPIAEATRDMLAEIGCANELLSTRIESIRRDSLINALLDAEQAAGLTPGLVALLNDENDLYNELDLIRQGLAQRGRQAQIINATQVVCRDNEVVWQDQPVTLTFNKMRISTENSPGWCWSAGFEQRYRGFLEGTRRELLASVNGIGAMTLGEDKSLLSLLRQNEFQKTLSQESRDFVDECVLWTAPLVDGHIDHDGGRADLFDLVRENRSRFVVKPANEGRGFRVVIGRFTDAVTWASCCRPDETLPCVVQEYAQPAKLPVARLSDHGVVSEMMYLTLGLAVLNGKFQGILSRVSPNPITNVVSHGIVQPVFCAEG